MKSLSAGKVCSELSDKPSQFREYNIHLSQTLQALHTKLDLHAASQPLLTVKPHNYLSFGITFVNMMDGYFALRGLLISLAKVDKSR